MHATQPQGGACPEPRRNLDESAGYLAGLLTDPDRFRAWVGQAAATVAHPVTSSLGELPHPAAHCDNNGQPHTGPCVEPGTGEATGSAAQVLRSAALYLERYGWIQGAYYDATAGVFTPAACMVGAIGMACYGGPVDAPAQHFDSPGFLDFEEAVLHLDRYLMVEDGSESYEFNDAKGRRAEDVTRVLRDAASRTADELINAIRTIDARNADMVAIAQLLTPSGIWGEQSTQRTCPSCGGPLVLRGGDPDWPYWCAAEQARVGPIIHLGGDA